MKRTLITIFAFILLLEVKAQIYTPSGSIQGNSGNNYIGVGIGNPEYRIHIKNSSSTYESAVIAIDRDHGGWGGHLKFIARNGSSAIPDNRPMGGVLFSGAINSSTIRNTAKIDANTTQPWNSSANGTRLRFWTTPNGSTGYGSTPRMVIDHNGYVGIATTIPAYTLDVNGTINATSILINGQPIGGGGGSGFWSSSGSNIYFNTGNVGIGTTDLSTHKLSVNGTIRTKEVIVETGWSDFVFEEGYQLKSLAEVEAFISENGHLPDIPSATEAEENGVKVGEMESKLLQKIEELTLYLIELKKENEEQQTQLERQSEYINQLLVAQAED